VGSVVGLNLAGANRAVREVPRRVAVACVTFHLQLRRPGQPALSRSDLLPDMVRHGWPAADHLEGVMVNGSTLGWVMTQTAPPARLTARWISNLEA
jgi:hypothetical protein